MQKAARKIIRLGSRRLSGFPLNPVNILRTLDYVRFIVLGRSRVGSNFLRGLLNSHSQVIAFGELFQKYDQIEWGFSSYDQSPRQLSLMQEDPEGFLEQVVFGKYPRKTAAVGFKIFYYHAQEGSQKSLWPYLRAQQDLRVIHIKRANILETVRSRKLAKITDKWANTIGTDEAYPKIHLSFEECLAAFTQTREWETLYDNYFCDHSKIEVMYDELASDYNSEMQRVQRFLGVNCEILKPSTFKQSSGSLSDTISNYFQLKKEFAGSEWQVFFVD